MDLCGLRRWRPHLQLVWTQQYSQAPPAAVHVLVCERCSHKHRVYTTVADTFIASYSITVDCVNPREPFVLPLTPEGAGLPANTPQQAVKTIQVSHCTWPPTGITRPGVLALLAPLTSTHVCMCAQLRTFCSYTSMSCMALATMSPAVAAPCPAMLSQGVHAILCGRRQSCPCCSPPVLTQSLAGPPQDTSYAWRRCHDHRPSVHRL